LKLIIH